MNDQTTFRALVVREQDGSFQRAVEERRLTDLPPGEVLIRVHFSSLNYKDALSASGNRGVTRKYPHTPGIDAAGVVAVSSVPQFVEGDEVICMGRDLGMNTPGGFGEYIRVPAAWVLAKPEPLSLYETMQIGTAGFTAAQCVDKLLANGLQPEQGPVLVTGATGGVGSLACALLAKLGFAVTAVTGKESAHDFLRQLGCTAVLNRQQAIGRVGAALLRERWAGVVDTVGGEILVGAIKATCRHGIVTCCGNAASGDLSLTVYPFILRGVSLVGIDSAECPLARRKAIWEQLAGPWHSALQEVLNSLSSCISLEQISHTVDAMLAGQTRGRIVVALGEQS
ncbi:YhdH/YhfP family quinone oxidoreductase [Candidatus Electronema sp. PJ]|uniref:YhdH/YhfP family quinone oxidoreductase n=1 Tax=Candidatus Electronema sp. PJ TaxID=3401572 RepID=UPI003AA876AA